MTFLWPNLLLTLLLAPLLALLYLWILRRRRRYAVPYSSLSLLREALPPRWRWRRHLPAAFFLLAVISLLTALARPAAVVQVPLSRTTIILALDVSRSMCATDVDPNRLTVAQEAASRFVDEQADDTKIGIVAFADRAELVVPPTSDKDHLQQALATLTTSIGTAIGSATLKGIDAIADVNPAVQASGANLTDASPAEPLPGAEFQPDIIVLLTDGANTRGPRPVDAAQQAADRQLRVYTIGFGSTEFTPMVCTAAQLGSDVFGDGFGGFGGFDRGGRGDRFRQYLLLDEPTLRSMAETTGGEYFRAENADQLLDVFRDLPKRIALQSEHTEISFAFAGFGALMLMLALALSFWWNRMP
jgi:Ca-activated chloride channel family protein